MEHGININLDIDLNKTAQEVYQTAYEHGWWEEDRSYAKICALIHSEISEALEDIREGNMGLHIDEKGKPVGFDSEVADIVIRCLDWFGRHGVNLENMMDRVKENCFLYQIFGEIRTERLIFWISIFHEETSYAFVSSPRERVFVSFHGERRVFLKTRFDFSDGLKDILECVLSFCVRENIDIKSAIEKKAEYNKSRPYKHGNKVC